jgi:hypothetical protein
MEVDYLPDERRAAAMNLGYDIGSDTPAAFRAGWRAACEAWQARAQAKAAADWRAACVVDYSDAGDGLWDVHSPTGLYFIGTCRDRWFSYDEENEQCLETGTFESEADARAALAACPTPPPDAEVKP